MRYLHTMVRVRDLEQSLHFYKKLFGLSETHRKENQDGRFTLVFLAALDDRKDAMADNSPELELTYNWDDQEYDSGRNFGHLAYEVDDIYQFCQNLMDNGITINRPPRDGHMAFVKSPDNISIEILQKGKSLEPMEPWLSMKNTGTW
ncbi:VOC family protein [Bartonella sp. HY406]|uniref:VOC family protein n=1 Tax=Bartonella sp. HY406 TaxID=2979331 RepID=UPI0021C74455|nr:VOC family protein [Bartonella sp. HY406]UXN04235.1 VOC family protein [Bartonella sp. HY406]